MRILTIDEVLKSDFVYIEFYTMPTYTPTKRFIHKIEGDALQLTCHYDLPLTVYISEYGEWWRCWSEMPTKEQQEAERWF